MTLCELLDSEFEEARPSSIGEEEMQLQIAMALSREECEKEEELRKGDAIRLQVNFYQWAYGLLYVNIKGTCKTI